MKELKFLIPAFLLMACGGGDDSESTTEGEGGKIDSANVEIENEIPIDITLNKISEFPSACETQGNVVDTYTWSDQNGYNYFIRTITEIDWTESTDEYMDGMGSQYLYAYHYVENAKGEISLVKETTDFVKDCEFDIVMGHELDAISLTDIDGDEIGEISFIYRLACTSDVSPSTQKLIMLENGDKYPLRGVTQVMGEGGEYEVGEEFDNAPEGFLDHAKELWSQHLVEYDFDL